MCEPFNKPQSVIRTQQSSQHTSDPKGLRTTAPQVVGMAAPPHSMSSTISRHGVTFDPTGMSTTHPSQSATVLNQQSQDHIFQNRIPPLPQQLALPQVRGAHVAAQPHHRQLTPAGQSMMGPIASVGSP